MLLLVLALFVTGTIMVAWTVAGRRVEEIEEPQEIAAGTLLSILVPKLNDKTPLSAEMMFASLHGLLSKTPGLQEHLSFEIVATNDGIRFYVYLPTYFRTFVEGQIYAQYPTAQISEVPLDYAHHFSSNTAIVTAAEVTLTKEYFYPIKTFVDFQVDPLAAITGSVERLNQGEQVWMQILLRPLDDIWQQAGYEYVEKVRAGKSLAPQENFISSVFKNIVNELVTMPLWILSTAVGSSTEEKKTDGPPKLSSGQELELKSIENKMTKLGFETALRIVSISQTEQGSQQALASIMASLKQFSMTHLNSFRPSPVERRAEEIFHDYQGRIFPGDDENYFVLNSEELASIYHLPNLSVETPTIAWSKAKQAEPPLDLPQDVETVFAKTAFRNREVKFGINREDRRRHMYIIGKTGTGKSTLMENMVMKDILAGEGVAVMDPHGDTIDKLLDNIPEERIKDVVLFDPSDAANPVSLNMLELLDPSQKNLTASAMVDVFKRTFDSWGPRLEYLLRNCFLTLAETPNSTLLGVNRLLLDKDYRKFVVSGLEDEQLRSFWTKEYANMASNDRLITEAVSPIQNKVGQFLQTSTIRNIMGQSKSTIRIDQIMNEGKILLVNLSKGKIGNDNSALLGSMIIARLKSAAMTRVNMPEEQRRDFYVYADEFQNFATDSFAEILSEARKYRLNLIITHQYIDQLPEAVRQAVFGNVGTTISFTVGPNDASVLSSQFSPVFTAEDLVGLEKHHIYLKLMIDGMESRPFSAATLPPIARHEGHRQAIIAHSRKLYSTPLAEVEEKIAKWNIKKFNYTPEEARTIINGLRQKAELERLNGTYKADSKSTIAKAEREVQSPEQEQKQVSSTAISPKAERRVEPTTVKNGDLSSDRLNPVAAETKTQPQVNRPHRVIPRVIQGVPGGVGYSGIRHISTSGSSGEIILPTKQPASNSDS
jgi:hypothetical protein